MKSRILLLYLFLFVVSGNNIFSQGTWNLLYPSLQTNSLKSVYFVNSMLGFAVGESGTILKTTNGGDVWSSLNSGIDANFNSVHFYNQNVGYAVGSIWTDTRQGIIVKTTNGGQSWTVQPNEMTGVFFSVCVVSVDICYAVGEFSKIFKTTNGGTTWVEQNSRISNNLNAVKFADANTGFIVGDNGTILKTVNGGANWIAQTSGITRSLFSICILNSNSAFVAGAEGFVRKTTDGGASWNVVTPSIGETINSITFSSTTNGVLVGYGGKISRTTNGGVHWFTKESGTANALYSVSFSSANYGIAVGTNGYILKTTDGGSTWIKLNSKVTQPLYGIQFTSNNIGYAVGYCTRMLKTTNGGVTWDSLSSGLEYDDLFTFYDLYFLDDQTGYVVGSWGYVLKTTNGGTTWTEIKPPHSSMLPYTYQKVYFQNNTTGFILAESGVLQKTTNGGSSWNYCNTGTSFQLEDISFPSANIGYIAAWYGTLLKTTNGGQNWVSQNNPSEYDYYGIHFISDNVGYAVGALGTVVKTTDGGANWLRQESNTPYNLYSVHFINEYVGFATGQYGTLIRTFDGGLTWENEISVTNSDLYDMNMLNSSTLFVSGYNANILEYTFSREIEVGSPTTEKLFGGNLAQISWTKKNVSLVKILFSTDKGKSFTTIKENLNANLENYSWRIPNIDATDCKIRVQDQNDNSVYGESSKFSVGSVPVKLISPTTGEALKVGITYQIKWTSKNIDKVKIEISYNGKKEWSTIVNNLIASTGLYDWKVPGNLSRDCYIRITDVNNTNNNSVNEKAFSIYEKSLTLKQPNGGEHWIRGSIKEIKWESYNIANVKLQYNINQSGSYWSDIVGSVSAASGSYSWTVPAWINSNKCEIKVSEIGGNGAIDSSDSYFTIANSLLSLTSPVYNSYWKTGSTMNISWTSVNITNVKLLYSTNSGVTWNLIADNIAANIGTYNWIVPNIQSQVMVKIMDISNASNSDYETVNIYQNAITVSAPNGGEIWNVYTTRHITWSSVNVQNVGIDYSTNDGNTWIQIVSSVPATPAQYVYSIPNTPSNKCRVRVRNVNDNSQFDISDNYFTIQGVSSQSLSISLVESVKGDTVLLDAVFQLPADVKYNSAEIALSGFNNKLQFLEIVKTGTLSNTTSWISESNYKDTTLYIALAGSSNLGLGTLCKLKFKIADNAVRGFIPVNINSVTLNNGTITLDKIDGGVSVLQVQYGNVDLNGIIQAYDAACILRYLAGAITLNQQQKFNADVSRDKTISAYDASVIMRFVVHSIDTIRQSEKAEGRLNLKNISTARGDTIQFPLNYTNGNNIYSFEGSVEFDENIIELVDIEPEAADENFIFDYSIDSNKVNLFKAGGIAFANSGKFTTLNFLVKKNIPDCTTLLKLINCRFNENEILDEQFIQLSIDEENKFQKPTTFVLYQNYPNPFNPSTTIKYQIPTAGIVSLKVYDALGKLVRTLVDEYKTEGKYSVNLSANSNIASGMYFYELRSGEFVSTKKMILVK